MTKKILKFLLFFLLALQLFLPFISIIVPVMLFLMPIVMVGDWIKYGKWRRNV